MNEDKMNREKMGRTPQDFNATQNSGWGEVSQEEKKGSNGSVHFPGGRAKRPRQSRSPLSSAISPAGE